MPAWSFPSPRPVGLAGALLAALLPSPGAALPAGKAISQYRKATLQTRDGLPQDSVDSLAQAPDGALWIGTQEGLVRYDGARFLVHDRRNTPALRHNRILALLADGETLWIGTEGGGLTALKSGEFTTRTTADGLPSDLVTALARGADGSLFVGTTRGVAILKDGNLRALGAADGVPGGYVRALASGEDGLYAGFESGELFRYAGGAFMRVETPGEREPIRSLGAVRGALWVGTNRGAFLLRNGLVAEQLRIPGGVPVRALREDRDGNLWIGTNGGGLMRLAGGRLETYGPKDGLPDDTVGALLEDREGNLWVGTQDGGLNRFSDAAFTPYGRAEGLSSDVIWAIAGDRTGGTWIGTKGGGVDRLAPDGSVRVLGARDGLSDPDVQAILEDPDGTLWFGTRNGGLNRLRDGKLRAFRRPQGLGSESVSALLRDRSGTLWAGTRDAGLYRLRAGERFARAVEPGAPGDVAIHSLLEDRDGTLWIGTGGSGLLRYKDGAFSAFTPKDGLSIGIVNTLWEDERGSLWIGTYGGGLNRLRGGKFASVTAQQGLFDDAVFGMVPDGGGNLWISCNKGVYRVALADLDAAADGGGKPVVCTAFGTADGMRAAECNGANNPPAWRSPDGRLWFPTVLGAVAVDPRHLPLNRAAPPVAIEEIVADGAVSAPRAPLTFPAGTERLEFQYTAFAFAEPARVRFRVRLAGYDRDWVDVGARRTAYYTHLPPGEYSFHVIACNDSGLWNETGASVAFRLAPAFHQTAWFWIAATAALSALVVLGVRASLAGAVRREAELVALVAERTRQLESANRDLKLLSTTDPLTGIANRRAFDEYLRLFWTQARRSGAAISVLMIDVDEFKGFNDAWGHLEGDACLKRIAEALTGAVSRTGDIVARFGGEEFSVLLLETPLEGCRTVAERMRERVAAIAMPSRREGSGTVTVSIGAATAYPGPALWSDALMALADELLYRAKREGRNRVVAADAPLGTPSKESEEEPAP